jgi:hypothetical protein
LYLLFSSFKLVALALAFFAAAPQPTELYLSNLGSGQGNVL